MSTEEDPIVICGMGCRLPGEVKSPSHFWDLIISGRSAQSEVPAKRFDVSKWHHPDPKRRGGVIARGGYFLSHDDEFRNFDPSFFGISSLEAASMGPQQRKLLEVAFETFESAGATLEQVSGSQTACYVGAFTADFAKTLQREPEEYWPYQSTGSDMTILSNRVNYVFNLKGPSLTVDTACSSSLYALHLACQGLLLHDFDAAIVAGTNIIMDVLHQVVATNLGILSPTSTCHTFDESADGFGRAEGITALYIKRMSDALTNGDPIRAIIRATAVNTNGKGVGISHPGVQGQEGVIRHAYKKARLGFDETAYVECHGTGTPVGDPIEVAAVGNVFAPGRSIDRPVLLSAVKSQIGHTEGASGLAAVQKVVMALEKGVAPATIGIKKLNPVLDLKEGRVKILQEHQPWPDGYRRAGVNSFGYGGANAHIIIDHANSYFERRGMNLPQTWTTATHSKPNTNSRRKLLVTSAHSLPSLEKNTTNISHLSQQLSLGDLAHTLFAKRTHFYHRAFTITHPSSSTPPSPSPPIWTTSPQRPTSPLIAFVFTGQGAQWPRMGISVLSHFPSAGHTFKRLQSAMDTGLSPNDKPSWTLLSALAAPPERSLMMTDVTWTVTLCTALQICLVDLLRSWHVQPVAVVGHSSGEAAAAYCAGLLTAEEAIVTSYCRALALKRNPHLSSEQGVMMAVGLGAREVRGYLPARKAGEGREVYLGCHNSPESVTLSGRMEAIDELEKIFKAKGIFARKVRSSGFANHSPMVERAAQYFRQQFKDSLPGESVMKERGEGKCRMYSCITAGNVSGVDVGIDYWAKNISAPVLFDEALQDLIKNVPEVDCLVEIGPHSALAGPIRQTKRLMGLDSDKMTYLPSLNRGGDGVEDMMRLAGQLYLAGYAVDLGGVNAPASPPPIGEEGEVGRVQPKFVVDLPAYAWTYDQIYWSESRVSKELLWRKFPRNDLLGSRSPDSTKTTVVWKNKLGLGDVPWVKGHRIGRSVLVPASAFVAMVVEGCRQCVSETEGGRLVGKFVLAEVEIMAPIRLDEKEREVVEVVTELTAGDGNGGVEENKRFRIASVTMEGKWTEHAVGYVGYQQDTNPADFHRKGSRSSKRIGSSQLYARFQKLGLNYGRCFRTLGDVRQLEDGRVEAGIDMEPSKGMMIGESDYLVHPATMDGCFQLAFAAVLDQGQGAERSYLPSAIPKMTIWSSDKEQNVNGEEAFVEGGASIRGLRTVDADFKLTRGSRLLMAAEVKFIAVEGLMGAKQEEMMPEPYQALSWFLDVDMLEGEMREEEFVELARARNSSEKSGKLSNGHLGHAADDTWLICLGKMVELLVFKRPGQVIVEVGGTTESTQAILDAISADARFPAAESFTAVDKGMKGQELLVRGGRATGGEEVEFGEVDLQGKDAAKDAFDLLVFTDISEARILVGFISAFDASLHRDGRIVVAGSVLTHCQDRDGMLCQVEELGWEVQFATQLGSLVVLRRMSTVPNGVQSEPEPTLYILWRSSGQILKAVDDTVFRMSIPTQSIQLSEVDKIPKGARVLSLLELQEPLLSHMDNNNMRHLKTLFKRARTVHWVTAGSDPRMALMQGMAKTLRAENPGLGLVVIQAEIDTCDLRVASMLAAELAARATRRVETLEPSVLLREERTWICRYVVDEGRNLNALAQSEGITTRAKFEGQLRLDMRRVGQVDSFFFRENLVNRKLADDYVRIAPTAFAMSKENAMTLKGSSFGHYFSHECVGQITEVARNGRLEVGDVVFCLAGSKIESELGVPERACLKFTDEASAAQMLGHGMAFLKGFVALIKIGRMRQGDIVMVRTEDESLKITASTLATYYGAKLADPQAKERLNILIDDGEGVIQEEIGKMLAFGGKVVNIRAEGIIKRYNSRHEAHAVSMTAIDGENILHSDPYVVEEALKLMSLLLSEWISKKTSPARLFDLRQLPNAVSLALETRDRERIVVRHGVRTIVPVHRLTNPSCRFSADGIYLMVGCLGGLGRGIALWMKEHGARHFVFLSRSGAEKLEAAALIDELREHSSDSTVKVVKGDVCNRKDVQRAVVEAGGPIQGVIQASTVYDDTRFDQMTSETWHYMLRPKMIGTTNLHLETLEEPLDFFVMTSSSIGLLGATTQTHYAAANAFLDAMAKYRRHLGLPGTALSLGMITGIGRFQEENGLVNVLQKRGAYDIDESEFLRMIEQACFRCHEEKDSIGVLDRSTLVTALDPTKFLDSRTTPEWVLNDPRLSHIGQAVKKIQPAQMPSTETGNDAVSELRAAGSLDSSLLERLVQKYLLEKLSSLVLTPVNKLEDSLQRPLSELGMDSIIGTELQAWLWREVKVSLDFMELFASQRSLRGFVQLIAAKLIRPEQ